MSKQEEVTVNKAVKLGCIVVNNTICNLSVCNNQLRIYPTKKIEEGIYPISVIVQDCQTSEGKDYQLLMIH